MWIPNVTWLQIICRKMTTSIIQGSNGHYFFTSNLPLSSLTYDITQSYMLSCGFRGHQGAPFAASDAAALSAALVGCGLLQQERLRLCRDVGECTTEVIKSAFKAKARCVGKNGVFLFSYHGPAVVCDSGHTLVSSNYRPDCPATHITSATILEWLDELESKPRQILCFLDCPFASEIGKPLVGPLMTCIEKVCVFCANTPTQSSPLTTSLQHSVFTYFAVWAFTTCTKTPELPVQRLIYIKDVGDKITECCTALNFLCVSETQDSSSAPAVMSVRQQPLHPLQRFDDDRKGQDMTDGEMTEGEDMVDGSVARFSFLQKYYGYRGIKKHKPKLCDQGFRWLQYLKLDDASPLHALHNYKLLTRSEMIHTILRLLLYSLALIQESNASQSTGEPNTLIVLYLQAAGVIEHVAGTEVGDSADQFELSFEAYCHALKQRQVNLSKVNTLAKKVQQDNQKK